MSRPGLIWTNHGRARAAQRCGSMPRTDLAIRLPRSVVRRLDAAPDSKGTQIWMTSSALLVVKSKRIVTVLRLHPEALASILAWRLTGAWPGAGT